MTDIRHGEKMIVVRLFLSVLILIFSFQSWTKADDISDIEIEGISIGESLLNHFSEKEILESLNKDYYDSTDFIKVEFWNFTPTEYEVISAHIKNNDKMYLVYELSGNIIYKDNIDECYSQQKIIIKELSKSFPNAKHLDSGRQTTERSGGVSSWDRYDLSFTNGSVDIICYNWSSESGFLDHLSVGINSKEFAEWLRSQPY